MKSLHLLLFLLIGLTSNSLFAQGWERIIDGSGHENAYQITSANDGNYFLRGYSSKGLGTGINGTFIMKISAEGNQVWLKPFAESHTISGLGMETDDFGNVLAWTKEIVQNGYGDDIQIPEFHQIDSAGNIIWERILFDTAEVNTHIYKVYAQTDGSMDFFAYQYVDSVNTLIFLGHISGDGTMLSIDTLQTPLSPFHNVIESINGGYYYYSSDGNNLRIVEIDAAGAFLGMKDYLIGGYIMDMVQLPNSDIIVISNNQTDKTNYVQNRLDTLGNLVDRDTIWSGEKLSFSNLELLPDGLIITGHTYVAPPAPTKINLLRTDLDGNVLWHRRPSARAGRQAGNWGIPAHGDGFIVVGAIYDSPFPKAYVFKTDDDGNIYTNNIVGEIALDINLDCLVDSSDQSLEDWIITAENFDHTFVGTSNANGSYQIPIDTGTYFVRVSPPSPYWLPCQNDYVHTVTDTSYRDTLNFSLQSIDCPYMTVSGVVPRIRPCFELPAYINYCNFGTVVAENAYLEVVVDSLITVMSSSLPWSSVNGNTYTFDLGDVDPLECGSFTLDLMLDCNAMPGLSYCLETHIYPDSLCIPPPPQWSGAFLEASGICQNEEVLFRIQNTGENVMGEQSHFIIVEDAVLIKYDSVLLNSGEIRDIPILGNGSAYTLIANQVPNAPGLSMPMAFVEACGVNNNGGVSTNFSNQFAQNDADPFVDIDCPIAVNSYDPNDKHSYPLGYRDEHYIQPNTPIEYMIRFQNTGTDTAYTVTLRDTLDDWLDIRTIQRGVSSHPYDFEASGEGALQFTFYDINLPDSSANLIASEGFVAFKIYPRETTPLGTVITNEAAIYFDYNPPIITNETYHTIAEDFIEVLVGTTTHPTLTNVEVKVQPNPFQEKTTFLISGINTTNYQLEVYDVSGRLVRTLQPESTQFDFYGKGLPQGLYFYQLSSADGFLNTGKIVIR